MFVDADEPVCSVASQACRSFVDLVSPVRTDQ